MIECDKRQFLFVVFNWQKGSYSLNCSLGNSFTVSNGFAFVEEVIKALKDSQQSEQK